MLHWGICLCRIKSQPDNIQSNLHNNELILSLEQSTITFHWHFGKRNRLFQNLSEIWSGIFSLFVRYDWYLVQKVRGTFCWKYDIFIDNFLFEIWYLIDNFLLEIWYLIDNFLLDCWKYDILLTTILSSVRQPLGE